MPSSATCLEQNRAQGRRGRRGGGPAGIIAAGAAGAAADLALRSGVVARALDVNRLQQTLLADGAYLGTETEQAVLEQPRALVPA